MYPCSDPVPGLCGSWSVRIVTGFGWSCIFSTALNIPCCRLDNYAVCQIARKVQRTFLHFATAWTRVEDMLFPSAGVTFFLWAPSPQAQLPPGFWDLAASLSEAPHPASPLGPSSVPTAPCSISTGSLSLSTYLSSLSDTNRDRVLSCTHLSSVLSTMTRM